MKKKRKVIALFLTTLLTTSTVPSHLLISYAVDNSTTISKVDDVYDGTIINVQKAWAMPGEQVKVILSMNNNPGIVGLTLKIDYNHTVMSLVSAENGKAVSGNNISFTPPSSGSNFVWTGASVKEEEINDGTLLTLTFNVNKNAKLGEYPIEVSCSDAVDNDLKQVPIKVDNSSFYVIDYIPGDTSADGKIAMNDLVLLTRYIADGGYNENGYAAKVNKLACDINGDSDITVVDTVLLARYIADGGCNPNGYNVTLIPTPFECNHASLKHNESVEAVSCQTNGNIEHWYCEECDKYFEDELCVNELNKEDTIIKGEHTAVVDPAVAPTVDKTGLTEGSHCSVCGEVITKQEVVPTLKENEDYSITYNIVGSDTYLATLNIDNPNPKYYSSGDVIRLQDLEVPGYVFEGWFDGQGKNANQITSISANNAGDLKLYAHWTVIDYHINFDTDKTLNNPDISSITYTVDRGATLPNMSLHGYYFMGWADERNNLVRSIPKGTIGNLTLSPIWTSYRNSTHPNNYAEEGAAAITEWTDDDGNANISFVYNVGTIENVPLYQISKTMNSSGLKEAIEETKTSSFTKECTANFVKAVSDATTNSTSWTLSSEWNETLEEDRSLIKNVTEQQIAASQSYYDKTGSICIGSGKGLSGTVSATDGTSSKSISEFKQDVGVDVEVSAKAGTENNYIASKSALSVKDEWTDTSEYGETHEETVSASGYWNTDISHSASSTAGGSNSFSNAITNSLETSERYGRIIQNALGNSETNTTEHYRSSSDSYSNTFVYSTDEETSTSHRIELDNAPEGYYRSVMVGTAYVFAVVNYNFATQQFFVNTYSVVDSDSYNTFWDYSASTTSFTDHQTGVLPFAVPFEVNEYVGALTAKTNGVTVNKETGVINGYTGTDTGVIIPEYISYDNKDGTFTSVKVTGVSADAFAGNKDIVAVYLPDSVTEIPAGAFKDCTSLKKVVGKNIKSIGTKAFQNCNSLKDYIVTSSVERLGSKAFENAGSVTINAANADIVTAACDCGANSIVLNLKDCSDALESKVLTIPNTAKSFKLEGAGKTLTNVQIVSNAEATEIHNVTMNNTIGRPLVTSSDSLTIGTSKIIAPALAIVLLSDKANITAYGQSSIVSKGEYAILSHNEAYSGSGETDIPKLNVTGNIAVCGNVEDESFVNFNSGKFIKIDEDEFERLLNNMFTVSFDAEGGTVAMDSMQAYSETSLGTLPTPTRANYVFEGWFTKDGTQVTKSTKFTEANDITLYAKWIKESFDITLNTNGGTSNSSKITCKIRTKVGELPTPKKPGYTFTGWFTDNGTKITAETIFEEPKDFTLFAHWSENAWSNWSVEKPSGDNIQVETRQVFKGYNMVSYCIKDATYGNLCYRGYSIPPLEPGKTAYDAIVAWGGSGEYGERSFANVGGTVKVLFTDDYIKSCKTVGAGQWYEQGVSMNADLDATAYVVTYNNNVMLAYIDSEVYETQYRWR